MKSYDAIVVGGGYPGTSIAYHLSKAGVKTLLVEKKEIAAGASGGNFGCIQVQDASLGLSLDLTLRSFKTVMKFEEILQADLELEYQDSLIAATSEPEMQELMSLYEGKKEAGMDIQLLGPKELKKVEPNMDSSKYLGATWYRQGRLNPFKLMYAFVREGKKYGLDLREFTSVASLYMEDGQVKGIVTRDEEVIRADKVIVAAGAWTRELCRSAKVDVPIEYVRAEGFVTERIEPFLANYYSAASFFTDAHDVDGVGYSLCMGQTQSGNLLIGETSKPGHLPPDEASNLTSADHFIRVRQALSYSFPALEKINLLRAWTTPSPYTESMEPIIGDVGVPGLLVAAGFKSCVVMTAVTGEIITDLVTKGETFCDLSSFNDQARLL